MTSPSRTFPSRLRHLAAAASLAIAFVAGCGSTEPKNIPIEQTVFADTLHINLARFTKVPSGTTAMYISDDSLGSGATAARGQKVSVRYVGSLANGSVFDKGVFPFTLGNGEVIPGWDIGIQGMKVGGRRTLIIPPELGYGASGQGPIPPYAVLVFDVTLVSAS